MILENYNECYHCGTVHPELCALVPAFRRNGGAGLDWEAGIPHRDGAWTFTLSGTTTRSPFTGLTETERTRHFGELAYPNLMLSLAADHVAAFTLWPRAADRTAIVFDVLVDPLEMAKPDYDPMDAVDFWDLVNGQDWRICEATQRGMSSRVFTHGHYAPMEDLAADMRRYIGEKLGRTALGPAAASLDTPNPPVGPPAAGRVDVTPTPSHGRDWDAIVVGLGGIGAAAAYWLSRRFGDRVLGLEQFPLFHERGESQDHSRIIRLSYHTPGYVELAKAAYGRGRPSSPSSASRCSSGPAASTSSRRAGRSPWPTTRARWRRRAFRSRLSMPTRRCGAGPSGASTTGRQRSSRSRPASRRRPAATRRTSRWRAAAGRPSSTRRRSDAIDASGGEFVVRAGDATYQTSRLAIAAGPWSNEVLGLLGRRLPLTVHREQVSYWATPDQAAFAPERFPIWIWMDEPSFYGFPVFGEAGTKAGQDVGGYPTTADARTFDKDPASYERVIAFLARRLPRSLGPEIVTRTCLYTLTPDRDFVISPLPEHPGVAVAIGAGHAFKFASQLGWMLSDLVSGGDGGGFDLGPFSIDRPILADPDPPRRWLV